MHAQQWILLGIIIVGGAAVIVSYIQGFMTHSNSAFPIISSRWKIFVSPSLLYGFN